MDKTNPPITFGVFKPVGHTVMAFVTEDALQAAKAVLVEKGFGQARLAHYSPQEMLAQTHARLLACAKTCLRPKSRLICYKVQPAAWLTNRQKLEPCPRLGGATRGNAQLRCGNAPRPAVHQSLHTGTN